MTELFTGPVRRPQTAGAGNTKSLASRETGVAAIKSLPLRGAGEIGSMPRRRLITIPQSCLCGCTSCGYREKARR